MLLNITANHYALEDVPEDAWYDSETQKFSFYDEDMKIEIDPTTFDITVKDAHYDEIIEELTATELLQYYG